MLGAIEHLMRLHPASRFGRLERLQSDLKIFEELESRHLRCKQDPYAERNGPTWMIGEAAAAAAMFVVFCAVLTVIARLAGDETDTAQRPVVAVSQAVEPR